MIRRSFGAKISTDLVDIESPFATTDSDRMLPVCHNRRAVTVPGEILGPLQQAFRIRIDRHFDHRAFDIDPRRTTRLRSLEGLDDMLAPGRSRLPSLASKSALMMAACSHVTTALFALKPNRRAMRVSASTPS